MLIPYGQRQFLTDNVSSLTTSVPYGQRQFLADNGSSLRTMSVPYGQRHFLTDTGRNQVLRGNGIVSSDFYLLNRPFG